MRSSNFTLQEVSLTVGQREEDGVAARAALIFCAAKLLPSADVATVHAEQVEQQDEERHSATTTLPPRPVGAFVSQLAKRRHGHFS